MPLPLLSYHWDDEAHNKPLVWQELFYTFEKYKAVFSFKLSTNQCKSPIGASSLLNSLFTKDFELHNESMTNFGSIEIVVAMISNHTLLTFKYW